MISRALRKLSRRHPGAAMAITLVIVLGGTAVLIWLAMGDMRQGLWVRPAGLLVVFVVIAIWLAWSGVSRMGRR